LYLEQVLREVLYMLLYSHELYGLTFGDVTVAKICMKMSLEEFRLLPWEVPVRDSTNFGQPVVGVMCVGVKSANVETFSRKYFDRYARGFLHEFCRFALHLQGHGWADVMTGFDVAIQSYLTTLDTSNVALLRVLAVGMLAQVRVAVISRCPC
jgi:hypothetical protein